MFTFQSVAWGGGAVAALCVVAFPFWIMGLPGQSDSQIPYVRGWKMGMGVITTYPLVWALNFLPYFIFRGLVSSAAQASWQNISQWIGAITLIAAILRLVWAFRFISKGA